MSKLKNVQILTTSAMLTALAIVLGFFKVPVSNIIEIRFAFLPIALAGQLFGPFVAGIIGILSDVGGYLVKPTGAFFPGFTLSSMLSGILYGLVLRGKKITIWRAFFSKLLNTVFISFLLNPLWLSILYGNGFWAIVSARLVSECILLPVNTAMIYLLLKTLETFHLQKNIGIPSGKKA